MPQDEFTPIQRRMLLVLSDGQPHAAAELHACLYERDAPLSNIQSHITAIRKRIRPKGQDIICVQNGETRYQHVVIVPISSAIAPIK
jgi:hypothetical protein